MGYALSLGDTEEGTLPRVKLPRVKLRRKGYTFTRWSPHRQLTKTNQQARERPTKQQNKLAQQEGKLGSNEKNAFSIFRNWLIIFNLNPTTYLHRIPSMVHRCNLNSTYYLFIYSLNVGLLVLLLYPHQNFIPPKTMHE